LFTDFPLLKRRVCHGGHACRMVPVALMMPLLSCIEPLT